MNRGDVIEYVTHMPMSIRLQREGDKVIAVLPAYHLPMGMMVEADSTDDAIDLLRVKVHKYWRGMPEE